MRMERQIGPLDIEPCRVGRALIRRIIRDILHKFSNGIQVVKPIGISIQVELQAAPCRISAPVKIRKMYPYIPEV